MSKLTTVAVALAVALAGGAAFADESSMSRWTGESYKAFEAARATSAQLLDLMTEADWKRAGEHSESGPYSTETWLKIYSDHAHNHADQIRKNRSAYKEKK